MFNWDESKNNLLKHERGVSFEEIVFLIEHGHLLAIEKHPNQNKYPNQQIYIVDVDNYAYLVPFVEDRGKILLKTIIPSRKATKKYLDRKGSYETN